MELRDLIYYVLLGGIFFSAHAQQKPFGENSKKKNLTEQMRVVDAITQEPLPGANIVYDDNRGAATDINGYATLSSDNDTLNVKVSYLGYSPLEKAIVFDGSPSINMIMLNPSPLESLEVVVSADRNKTLDAVLRNTEKINEKSITNTQLVTGSATEQVFAQMTGATTTPGNEFYYSSAGDEVSLKYHGIPMKTADFFNINGVLNSFNTDMTVTSFTPSPENDGMQVNINARMKKPREGIEAFVLLNQLRGSIGLSGNVDSSLGDRTWFGTNYEGNISSIYLKSHDISPRNNKYTAVTSVEWDASRMTLAGIHKNTSITLKQNDNEPSLADLQTGASLEYSTIDDASLDLLYVFNNNNNTLRLKKLLDTKQTESMHELRGMIAGEDFPGFLTVGIDAKHITYSQSMMLSDNDDLNLQSLKNKINPEKKFSIMPINIFLNQEVRLGENSGLALGAGLLFDPINIKKKIAVGPYAKFKMELLGMDAILTGRLSYSHIGLKPYSDDINFKEYTKSDYPKSFQAKFELRKGPWSGGLVYYDFYNQPKNNVSVNPLQEYFISHMNDLSQDSLKAIILISNPQILNDPDALHELDSMLAAMPMTQQDINDDLGLYETTYHSDPNRYGGGAFLEFRTENLFLTALYTKTFERGTGMPYSNDIELILKGHTYFDLSKYFTISAYAEYSTGKPYTGLILLPSIAEERDIKGQLETYRESLPKGYYELLSEKRQASTGTNNERYPASITASISLTWHLPELWGIEGDLKGYLNNPHNIGNLVEKNTYLINYTNESGEFAPKKNYGVGFVPGIDLTLRKKLF